MKKYNFDTEKSKVVYEHCGDMLQVKECYNNVFKVVTEYIPKFRCGLWRVAYGYMKIFDNLYCRHCFVIDENNKVIDPTLYTTERKDIDDKEHFVSYIFDDINAYFEAVEVNDFMPSLEYYLREYDAQAREWATENGYILI